MRRTYLLVAALFLVLITVVSSAEAKTAKARQSPVVIVSDFGLGLSAGWRDGWADVDDAIAVAMAARSSRLKIEGIVTTFGNTLRGPMTDVATPRFLDRLGLDIPVFSGPGRALSYPQVSFGDDKLREACSNSGTRFLARQARNHAERLTVVAIGPLTALGCLQLNHPRLIERIGRVVVLMGREEQTALEINGHKVSDFNFAVDVRAAQILFRRTEVPLTFITFETSSASLLTTEEITTLGSEGGRLGAYFARNSANWIEAWTTTFGEDGIHPWDANVTRWLTDPDTYSCEPMDVVSQRMGPSSSVTDTNAVLYVTPPGTTEDPDRSGATACTSYASDVAREEFELAALRSLSD